MSETVKSKAVWRALTTVNAPLPVEIDAATLLSCLSLSTTDLRWKPHVRAFFREVAVDVIMDLLVEGTASIDNLSKALEYWGVDEEFENARWIRDMAAVKMAGPDGNDAGVHGFRRAGRRIVA